MESEMSGGHFDYEQYRIDMIAEAIEQEMEKDDSLSEAVRAEFANAVRALRIAKIYAHRVDWFLSGDDSEESFLHRLRSELDAFRERHALTPSPLPQQP